MNPGEGLIRRARTARVMTQHQLADAAGVAVSSVSDAERVLWPSTWILHRYGAAMGLTLVVAYRDTDGSLIE